MVTAKHLHREDLVGRVIDAHSHIGIALCEAAHINFPYCSCAEDLAYRHRANGVDFGVVFPISPALYYDLAAIVESGELRPAARPVSRVPYRAREPPGADRRLPLLSGAQRPLPALHFGGSGTANRRANRQP